MPKLGMKPIRKAQVITAVLELTAASGLAGLTLDSVAARAGVSKGVINHYFKDKRDVLIKSFEALLDGYKATVVKRLEQGSDPARMLRDIVAIALTGPEFPVSGGVDRPGPGFTAGDIGRIMVHFMGRCVLDQDFRRLYTTAYETWIEGTAALIDQGVQSGRFKAVDPLAAAYGLFALVDGAALHASVGYCPLDQKRVLAVINGYIDGLIADRENGKEQER